MLFIDQAESGGESADLKGTPGQLSRSSLAEAFIQEL
jgi:hypothetical protein